MFERVSEAYEVLSDADRRRQYDTAGRATGPRNEEGAFAFAGFDFSFAARGTDAATFSELFADVLHPAPQEDAIAEPGADLYAALSISFEESFRGVERQVLVTRQVLCSACAG